MNLECLLSDLNDLRSLIKEVTRMLHRNGIQRKISKHLFFTPRNRQKSLRIYYKRISNTL